MCIVKFQIRTCCPCSCCGNQNCYIFPVSSYWSSKMQRQNMMQFSDSHQRKQCLIIFNKSCIFQETEVPEQLCWGNLVFISEHSRFVGYVSVCHNIWGRTDGPLSIHSSVGVCLWRVLSPGRPQCCRSLAYSLSLPMFHYAHQWEDRNELLETLIHLKKLQPLKDQI